MCCEDRGCISTLQGRMVGDRKWFFSPHFSYSQNSLSLSLSLLTLASWGKPSNHPRLTWECNRIESTAKCVLIRNSETAERRRRERKSKQETEEWRSSRYVWRNAGREREEREISRTMKRDGVQGSDWWSNSISGLPTAGWRPFPCKNKALGSGMLISQHCCGQWCRGLILNLLIGPARVSFIAVKKKKFVLFSLSSCFFVSISTLCFFFSFWFR